MMLSLFIPMLLISTFIDECVAEDPPNFVEIIMEHACVDVFGITKPRKHYGNDLINKAVLTTTAGLAIGKLSKHGSLIDDVLRLHILFKLMAGTTEVHKKLATFDIYLKFCDELAKKNIIKNNEESTHGKREKEGESSNHGGKSGKHKEIEKEEKIISSVLKSMELTEEDWKNLTKDIPIDRNIAHLLSGTFQFGFKTQKIAEEKMKASFKSIIKKNSEKKGKLHKLCLQIQNFSKRVYEKEIEERKQIKKEEANENEKTFTFGEFCEQFDPNKPQEQKIQSEAQSSDAATGIEEIE